MEIRRVVPLPEHVQIHADAMPELKRKCRAADKPRLCERRKRLQPLQQFERGGLYCLEVQHLKVSSLTFPRQAAKASVTGSSERICCASEIMNGRV